MKFKIILFISKVITVLALSLFIINSVINNEIIYGIFLILVLFGSCGCCWCIGYNTSEIKQLEEFKKELVQHLEETEIEENESEEI